MNGEVSALLASVRPSNISRDVPPAAAAGRRLRRAPERVTEMTCMRESG